MEREFRTFRWGPEHDRALDAIEIQEYEEAYRSMLPLAEAGDPAAQGLIGSMYHLGFYVETDEQAACHWYEQAAAGGNPGSAHNRSVIASLSESWEAGRQWRQKAWDLGFRGCTKENYLGEF